MVGEIGSAPDGGHRDPLGPPQERGFGVRGGEPGELDHLVDPKLPRGEGIGQTGKAA